MGPLVSVTLPTAEEIDVSGALWGHVPVPAFETQFVGDTGIEFRLRDQATNFGNRATGVRLRNKLENLVTQFPDEAVLIDFGGVDMLTASFADEFLAKMVKAWGPIEFFGRFVSWDSQVSQPQRSTG